MAYTRKIKAGLVPVDPSTFVGEVGTIFYNQDTGSLFLSDGITPGGHAISMSGAAGYTGSKGDTGLGFIIAKSYISVAALNADTAPTGIAPGQFAIIDTGNVEDSENSRLYLWTGSSYNYVDDLSGAAGITGPRGYAGSQGNLGYTGSQGPQGDTGYVGSQGIQGNTGYVGSQGLTGATGPQGNVGLTGSTGLTGYTGSQGIQGIQGSTGVTGDTGAQGYTGSQGVTGATGPTGATGALGYTGSQGDIGYTGSFGATGIQGPQGATGSLGYTGSTGTNGYTGSEGAVGATGVTGYSGSQGLTGSTGPIGYTGSAGTNGYTGSQGIVGATGVIGATGIQGATGPIGYTGSQGIIGATGVAGVGGALGYYGSFYDTTDQFLANVALEQVIRINSTAESNGVTIANGSRVTFANAGTYSIIYSIQFANTDNNITHTVNIWAKKNGIVLSDSNSRFDIVGAHSGVTGHLIASVNYVLTVAASDYIELYWSGDSTLVSIETISAGGTPTTPQSPAVILTATQVMYTQAGATGATGVQGYTGSAGTNGTNGYTGSQGDTGATGLTGYTGSVGSLGYTGSQGDTGATGPIGYTGSAGTNGTNGYTGSEGSAGATGPIGYTGSEGAMGATGIQGPAGPAILEGVFAPDLSNASSTYNTVMKFPGRIVFAIDSNTIYVATGTNPTDPWYGFSSNPGVTITPFNP